MFTQTSPQFASAESEAESVSCSSHEVCLSVISFYLFGYILFLMVT